MFFLCQLWPVRYEGYLHLIVVAYSADARPLGVSNSQVMTQKQFNRSTQRIIHIFQRIFKIPIELILVHLIMVVKSS